MSKLETKHLYACDICGHVGEWKDGWWRYSSIALDETCPNQVPTMCSEACKLEFDVRLEDGRITLPTLRHRGPYMTVTHNGHGYPVVAPRFPKPQSVSADSQ